MRKNERGLRTMFGSEPFAGTITDRPTGITFAGGSPCRPTRGCRTRVNCPGGSLPINSLTSCPLASSAAAWSSACSTTAPQNDHENGTTMPIFTTGSLSETWGNPWFPHTQGRPRRGAAMARLVFRANRSPAGRTGSVFLEG